MNTRLVLALLFVCLFLGTEISQAQNSDQMNYVIIKIDNQNRYTPVSAYSYQGSKKNPEIKDINFRVPEFLDTGKLDINDPKISFPEKFLLARVREGEKISIKGEEIELIPELFTEAVNVIATTPNRINMVFLGDGYTSQTKFNADVAEVVNQAFAISPLAEYKGAFEINSVFTPSAQNGADHPPYLAGCSPYSLSCCADTYALSDPYAGQFVSTAFDSSFCYYGIHRLIFVNTSKVLSAAAAVPEWDYLVILINDPVYGGSGGTFTVFSLNNLKIQTFQHELGHVLGGLADTYDSPYPGYPPCSDYPGSSLPCEPNVTNYINPAKWASWIVPGGEVGLYEGARYLANGMWRSESNDIMRDLYAGKYDAISKEALVCQILDKTSLIEGTSPAPGNIQISSPTLFQIETLPINTTYQINWYLNGNLVGSGASYYYQPSEGSAALQAQVIDKSKFIKTCGGQEADSVTWNISPQTVAAKKLFLPLIKR